MLLDGYVLDKKHTFSAYSFSALNNIQAPEENWEPPQKEKFIDVVSLFIAIQLHLTSFGYSGRSLVVAKPDSIDVPGSVRDPGRAAADRRYLPGRLLEWARRSRSAGRQQRAIQSSGMSLGYDLTPIDYCFL